MGLPLNAAPLSLLLERGAGRSLGLFFFEKKKKIRRNYFNQSKNSNFKPPMCEARFLLLMH